MLQYRIVPVTAFAQNCSVLWCDQTMKGAVVDPGGDIEIIATVIKELGVEVDKILLTHAHIDHAGGTAQLAKQLNLSIEGPHKDDQFWIDGLDEQAKMFGFDSVESFTPDRWLEHGDTVKVGNETLEVIYTPGHTPGHVVFYAKNIEMAWVGDVLFAGSIGRTDFPRGDHQTLINSICQKLWPLGNSVEFVCGHGPNSTFGQERQSNPLVGDSVTGLTI